MNPESTTEGAAAKDPKDPAKIEKAEIENKDLPAAGKDDVKGGAAFMKYDNGGGGGNG